MDKELQLCSVDAADEEEMVSQQQPERRKGGLVTMPFIIGILSMTCMHFYFEWAWIFTYNMVLLLLWLFYLQGMKHLLRWQVWDYYPTWYCIWWDHTDFILAYLLRYFSYLLQPAISHLWLVLLLQILIWVGS